MQSARGRSQISDSIRTDAVDAELLERGPLRLVVGCPRNDTCSQRVSRFHELLVYIVDMLPEVLGADRAQGCNWIHVPGHLEHSAANRRKDPLYRSDDTVVKGVNRAARRGFAYAPYDERLDVRRLDLDVSYRALADLFESFRQGRDRCSGNERVPPQLWCRCRRDAYPGASRHISRIEDGIVMNDYDAIGRSVNVQLDTVGPELESPPERRNRVFGQTVVGAPVRDRNRCPAGSGQMFLKRAIQGANL